MGRSTWRRSLERRPAQARAKKPQPASLCRMAAPERERDESDWKRYGQTGACFRVTRSRNRGHHFSQQRDFPIICGKTQLSKITRVSGNDVWRCTHCGCWGTSGDISYRARIRRQNAPFVAIVPLIERVL